MRPLTCLCALAALAAGEAAPAPAPAPAVPPAAVAPDPAQAVVAEGRQIYRQRDLDALLLVALRHARTREFASDGKAPLVTKADEERLREVILAALTAREAFAGALAGLPAQIPAAARDAIALDLLAWKAEANPQAKPGTFETPPAGPALVRLPPFTVTRAIDGQGRRQLTLGLAIAFPDAAAAKAAEGKAPVIQDAVLAALRELGPAVFLDPDHAELKQKLGAAVKAKLPDFPADGLLIPQLETGPADAPAER